MGTCERTLRATCENDRTVESGIRCMNSNEAVLISAQCNKLLWERRLRVGSFSSVRQDLSRHRVRWCAHTIQKQKPRHFQWCGGWDSRTSLPVSFTP
jgi:hypothetical protein